MEIRITNQTQVNRILIQTRQQTDRLGALQEQVTTGKRLLTPSDAPLDMTKVLTAKSLDERLNSYLANVRDARTTINQGANVLQEVHQVFIQARAIAIEGANAGQATTDLNALARATENLLERLVLLANTQQNGRYLFSGTALDTMPFQAIRGPEGIQSVIYQGGHDRATVPVNLRQDVTTLYPGSEVFQQQTGLGDAFQVLIRLRDELRDTSGLTSGGQSLALSQRIGELERVANGILSILGEQATDAQNLDTIETRVQDLQLETRRARAELEETDFPEVIVRLQAQENLFRLTLATAARMFDQNLLDFLR